MNFSVHLQIIEPQHCSDGIKLTNANVPMKIIKCIGFILVRTSLGQKWHKHHLTYHIMNWPRSLPPSQVHLAVSTAFQLWSNVSGLLFQELQQGPTDIRLAFFEGEHNDGTRNAFDGPGEFLSFFLNKLN